MTRTETKYSYNHANESIATVQGMGYLVWHDYERRQTVAENIDGVVKVLRYGGYITNDLTVRKAIASAYGLSSFRK